MKKRATKTNNTDPRLGPRCTSINQEGDKMYIMTLRSLKSTKQMHFIYKIILYSENGGHLEKMAAILDFQVAPLADLTSSLQRTFVPNLVLVSQFARLVPLSAPL